uniref:BED-type domain-containing protein n=1 Tax=Fagus sylvatica TaxID=28930 RepID=A0A2N9G2F6_FAGSY
MGSGTGTGSTPTTPTGSSAGVSSLKKRRNSAGSRLDPGWEHGIEVDGRMKVKCRYCGIIRSGGIYRLKHHLAGTRENTEPCSKVPEDVRKKFLDILKGLTEESLKKKRSLMLDVDDDDDEDVEQEVAKSKSKSKGKGIFLDRFVRKKSQTTMNQMFKKKEREEICMQIAKFFYTSAIPFNCVNNPEFGKMIDMVSRFGSGFKPPSFHEIREKYLKKHVTLTLDMLEEYKQEWGKMGCSIMSDGWTDKKRRSLCNFLVNSPKGTVFMFSLDTSDISKTADKVFEMLDNVIEMVGEENVVQIVTDNASNYKKAGKMLMEKRKKLYWTPCAAHCIDLILEDFEKKLKIHSETIANAKKITTYIYGRTMLISLLKEFTKDRDLVRPGATRFATSYLTLACLNEHKAALMAMISSSKWKSSKFVTTKEGRRFEAIVLDSRGFWPYVTSCLRAAAPLIKVLRLVDSDEPPAMGFLYEAMDRAREKIITDWWISFGDECPELQNFAVRVLSLTCSSSGCERNWSAFDMVHTKRRNRLLQKKMNDLVFVMCNLNLINKPTKKATGTTQDSLEDISSDDEWIAAEESPNEPNKEWPSVFHRDAQEEDENGLSSSSSILDFLDYCLLYL